MEVDQPKTTFTRDVISLKKEISDFYLQGSFTDVTLSFCDGQLHGHRLVLASASSYLKSLLRPSSLRFPADWEEEGCSSLSTTVNLPDFSIKEGRLLLERIYGVTEESAQEKEGEDIPPEALPLVETLRIHRALPEELQSILKGKRSDLSSSEEEDETPLESLLQSTHTVAIRRSLEAIKQCSHCDSSWDDDIKLKNHILIDHRGVVQCSECELHFDEYVEFEAHREDHYEDSHQQQQEAQHVEEPPKAKKKKKSSTPAKKVLPPPSVETLPKPSSSGSSYRPSSPGSFKCEHCPEKIFESQTILDYHKLRHADRNESFCCSHCDRRFNSEKGLKYHLNKHEGVADFLCDDCGSRFITRQKLLNHRRSKHTFERPYVCEACGDAFTRSDKLIVHIRRAHTGEKPYQCEFCEWRGVDSSALIHHKKKHGPDKMTKTIKRYVHMPQNT